MFKKMMKHLANNPGLKLLSILFAIVLWLVVVNVADPDMTKSFSVPVEILNKDVIAEMGKVPDIVGDTDIAVFYITGPRSYVEDMSGDDFSVTADLSQIDLSQEGEQKLVPIEVVAKKNDRKIDIIRKTVNMQITLEDLSEKKFIISAETTGTPAEGCAIGEVEVTPNLLTVSGPETVVSRISRVTASINVDGISSDVSDSVIPTLYDEEENVVSSDMLDMNREAVTIRANILATKKVPVRFQVSGTPADGYVCQGLEYAPENVQIKGEADVLNAISAIDVPAGVIDVTGATKDMDFTVDITPYLRDDDVLLTDESENKIAVKALIVQKAVKTFNIPTSQVEVTGLDDAAYRLSFNGNTIPVTVRALQEDMESLRAEDIAVALDVSGMAAGAHSVELSVTLPGTQYELAGDVSAQVVIAARREVLGAGDSPVSGNAQDGSAGDTDGDAQDGPAGDTGGDAQEEDGE